MVRLHEAEHVGGEVSARIDFDLQDVAGEGDGLDDDIADALSAVDDDVGLGDRGVRLVHEVDEENALTLEERQKISVARSMSDRASLLANYRNVIWATVTTAAPPCT